MRTGNIVLQFTKSKKWSLLETMDWGQSMKRLFCSRILRVPVLVVALGAIGLSGCTTMRGAPENVLDMPESSLIVSGSKVATREEVIAHYVRQDVVGKQEFRNRVIDHYMGLIDKQYDKYSSRLFSEGIELALGFDAAIIGLSSTAALFEEVADDLATVIAGFAGIQSSINKNLYFDRTLPALIVTMDAERANVETELLRQKGSPVTEYTIEAAIRDLRRYQQAGTLMRAITNVTETASEEKAIAERNAKLARLAVFGCTPDAELIRAGDNVRGFVVDQMGILSEETFTTAQKQKAASGIVVVAIELNRKLEDQLDISKEAVELGADVADVLRGTQGIYCDVSELNALQQRLSPFLNN
ncbi:hypothetical protein [Parasphingorhabdus sp.]|uniref:hypothetical protein n=1 Tax=Parasphingorhabdus sp. TaxID=2709688 RepID=UPI003C796D76